MTLNRLINRRRSLLLLAAFAAAWGLIIFVTRGFVIETPWRPITSRAAIRPLAVSLLLLLVYVARYRRHWREDLGSLARIDPPRAIVTACTSLALIIALGYGPLDALYSLGNVPPNLLQYGRGFFASQTPLPLIGLLAPVVSLAQGRERMRVLLVTTAVPLAVLAMYLPYVMFESNAWSYLRFLLPAYPALMAGCGIVAIDGARRARRPALVRGVAAAAVGIMAIHGWMYAVREGVFDSSLGDRRYARAIEHVQRLPPHSVFLSLAYSGTLRYYTGRDIVRFDAMRPEDLDRATEFLRGGGYAVYLVGDAFEIDVFRKRFAGTDTAALLATAPYVDLGGAFIYTL